MALTVENGHEAPLECPVCFENVLPAKRTLACRHVFCQDCLSKIIVVAQSQGSIVCPLCRQATILIERKEPDDTAAGDVGSIQEVALPLPRASILGLLRGGNWLMHHLRLSRRSSEQTVANRNRCQVFIISDQVRPATRNDTAVSIPEDELPECTECMVCRVTKCDCICLVVVICLITVVSVLLVNHL